MVTGEDMERQPFEPDDENQESDEDENLRPRKPVPEMVVASLASASALVGHPLPAALLPFLGLVRGHQHRRFEAFMKDVEKLRALDELHDQIVREPRAANLFADAARAAWETDIDQKRRALANVLHRGLFREDDAELDIERMYIQAIALLEVPHLRILDTMRHVQTMKVGGKIPVGSQWPSERLIEFYPECAPVLPTLMTQLESSGLVVDDQPASTRQPENARWRVTAFGGKVYEFLKQTPDGEK